MISQASATRPRARHLALLAPLAAALAAVLVTTADAASDTRGSSARTLVDRFAGRSLDRDRWRYWWGDVRVTRGGVVLASPSPTRLDQTRSALITSHRTWRNFAFDFTTTPLRQLRLNDPGNTWETSWVMFRFRDLANYYYFIVKPNGWELGKKHGSDAQIFLATGESPRLPIGATANVRLVVRGARIRAWIGGVRVMDYVDPKPLAGGSVGLYQEDARVRFSSVRVGVA